MNALAYYRRIFASVRHETRQAMQRALETLHPSPAPLDTVPLVVVDQREVGILAYSEDQMVSTDLKGDLHSSNFSAADTIVVDDLVKVVAWYDNEWGYVCRIADLAHFMMTKVPSLAGPERN